MTDKPVTLIFIEAAGPDPLSYEGVPVMLDDEQVGHATNPQISGTMLYVDLIPSSPHTGDEIMDLIHKGRRVTLDLSRSNP